MAAPRPSKRSADASGLQLQLLLLIAVVVPVACALWFMIQAMQNERLAIRQRWVALAKAQLDITAARIPDLRTRWLRVPKFGPTGGDAAREFAFVTSSGTGPCESLILYDTKGGVRYPSPAVSESAAGTDPPELKTARSLEFIERDFPRAADAYAKVADQTSTPSLADQAVLGQARCLRKAGRPSEATALLNHLLRERRFDRATNPQGRSVALNAQIMALEWIDDPTSAPFQFWAQQLAASINDYEITRIPSSQRRFLMHRLRELDPAGPVFPTLKAEDLAAEYLETRTTDPAPGRLEPTHVPGLYEWTAPDGRWTALVRHEAVAGAFIARLSTNFPNRDFQLWLLPPGAPSPSEKPLAAIPAGDTLPGWTLQLFLRPDALNRTLGRQTALYVGVGISVVLLALTLGLVLGQSIRRQVKLTQLRNDLIATVSHELKTPLSSIRLLIDTILEGRCSNELQKTEYLGLIAKENTRLSRLIDNFLTFSRMERNKHAFQMTCCDPGEIATSAAEAMSERFASPECSLEVNIQEDLPPIRADRDAMVTVLVNLLENAYKYSGQEKRVQLRVSEDGSFVRFAVEDNGIGISRRAQKRIFERFYQVDQRLSRETGGCGLGLSIVRFVVDAHDGTVSVESEPEKGSVFTVAIPLVPEENDHAR